MGDMKFMLNLRRNNPAPQTAAAAHSRRSRDVRAASGHASKVVA
jgi:hypothetical protein